MPDDDPFRHHPALRDLITPPEASGLRDMQLDRVMAMVAQHGGDTGLFMSEAAREADRAAFFAGRPPGDLWVFGYGSLIWDPAVLFTEVRRAYAPTAARRFILRDIGGGRGNPERPGVMAALDDGGGCHGVAFRIAAHQVPDESYRLWLRERIGAAYRPAMIPLETAQGPIEALTFMADYDARLIKADMTHDEQVRCCATGAGFLGSSFDYVRNIATHFAALHIDDPEVTRLLEDARAYRQQAGLQV